MRLDFGSDNECYSKGGLGSERQTAPFGAVYPLRRLVLDWMEACEAIWLLTTTQAPRAGHLNWELLSAAAINISYPQRSNVHAQPLACSRFGWREQFPAIFLQWPGGWYRLHQFSHVTFHIHKLRNEVTIEQMPTLQPTSYFRQKGHLFQVVQQYSKLNSILKKNPTL